MAKNKFPSSKEDTDVYLEAQHKTIEELSKKLQKSEEKCKQLEEIVKNAASIPTIGAQNTTDLVNIGTIIPQAQIISEQQIFRLKQISDVRELTYEETKKFEIFSKVLKSFSTKDNNDKDLEKVSDEELMNVINGK